MASRRLRILLDTSALIAGILSPEGGAGAILEACRLGLVELYLSPGIIKEATEKFHQKFPEFLDLWFSVIKELHPIMIADPSKRAIREAALLIEKDDAPILACTMRAPIDYFVTLDRDFRAAKVQKVVPFAIVTPAEFLKEFTR